MAEEKYKVGDRFNSWTILGKRPKRNNCTRWFVACDCGVKKETYAGNIVSGKSRMCGSCGATKREAKRRAAK